MVMKKVFAAILVAASTLVWNTPAAAFHGDGPVCERGDSAVLVRIDAFKERRGMVRVQIYGSNPADFLVKGKKLKRVDVPVARNGRMDICVALPGPGNYAVAVRHDIDGNGKSGWNDGGGFSRNPKISLANLRPSYRDVVVQVGNGVRPLNVTLNYRRGLTIAPVTQG
jgi:uncharacterized protein (DUF2141 family)